MQKLPRRRKGIIHENPPFRAVPPRREFANEVMSSTFFLANSLERTSCSDTAQK